MNTRAYGTGSFVRLLYIFALGAGIAQAAATYFVDSAHGSDGNDGLSEGTAWASIARVNDLNLNPGDTVLLKRGSTWNETLSLHNSGIPGLPITIADYGSGDKPLLLGGNKSRNALHAYGQSYIYVRNVAVTDGVYGFLFDGGSANNTLDSVEASFNRYDGIAFQDPGSTGNTVINSTSHDNGRSGVFFWDGADNGKVTGGAYYNNSTLADSSGVAVGRSAGAVISNVISYGNAYGIGTYGAEAANILIRKNTVFNNYSSGIDLDYSGGGIFVEANTVSGSGRHGIYVEGTTSGTIVRYNITHDNGTGNQGGITLDGTEGVQVYYNVVYNEPVGIWGLGAAAPSIYNNVVYKSATCMSFQDGSSYVRIENNIASACDRDALFISSDSGSNLVSNYNDWNMNGKATLQWGGTYLLSQWQQSFSQDLASIDADPLFANPNQGDFHLTSGSPALAKGATIGFTTDAAGVPLPAGGPIDMGAYQSSGVSGQSAVQLIARNSGKCLDVPGSSSGPIQVDQWQCLAGINQKWNLIALGDGSYELASASSGMALDVAGGSMADGVPVMQWPYWGASHQRWYLQQSADGYVQLTAQHSGKCLEVSGGPDATGNGVGLQQWSCWGGANQQWQLVPAR